MRALQEVRVLQVAAWGRSQGFASGCMGQVTEFCKWLHGAGHRVLQVADGAGHRVLQVAAWGRSQSFASGCMGQVTENFTIASDCMGTLQIIQLITGGHWVTWI